MSKKKLLIVVDMQNDFINGALGSPEAAAIVSNVAKKIEEARANNDFIIFTQDTHYDDYMETEKGKNLPARTAMWRLTPPAALESHRNPTTRHWRL